MAEGFPSLLSRPIKLVWAGWETDTWRLQQEGWQISARQDIHYSRMSLAIKHYDLKISGITDEIEYDYMRLNYPKANQFYDNPYGDYGLRNITLRTHLASQLLRQDFGRIDLFRPVDAMPQMKTVTYKELDDFAHFASPMVRTQQIIVPEESVQDLLDRVLKLQEPARNEHFKRIVTDEYFDLTNQPRQKVHAQIISLADYQKAA